MNNLIPNKDKSVLKYRKDNDTFLVDVQLAEYS